MDLVNIMSLNSSDLSTPASSSSLFSYIKVKVANCHLLLRFACRIVFMMCLYRSDLMTTLL